MRPLAHFLLGLSVLWSLAACGATRIAVEPPPQSTVYQRGTDASIDQQITEVEQLVPEQRQAPQKTYYQYLSNKDILPLTQFQARPSWLWRR